MKKFFANKVNVILTLILVVVIGIASYFTYELFATPKIMAIDFVNMRKDAIDLWAKENKVPAELINFEYEYSEEKEKDVVIFQTIKEGEEIKEPVTLTLSKGSDPSLEFDLSIFVSGPLSELQDYLAFNKISMLNVSYNADSELDKDNIISIEPLTCKRSDVVNVIVSGADENEEKVPTDGKAVLIPDDLLGLDEAGFKSKLNKLGFNNLSKSSVTYYSENMKADTVYSYDDGSFTPDTKIRYALCAGKVDVESVAKELKGLSVSKAKTTVSAYNDRNAQISVKFDATSGTVESCSVSKKTISCTVKADGASNSKAVIPDNLLGKSEADFLKLLENLGFTNIVKDEATFYSTKLAKGSIYSYDDGEFKLSDKITYALSAGDLDIAMLAKELSGVSSANATSKIADINKRNGRVELKTSGSGNTIDNCSVSGRTISCALKNVSESDVKTATIPGNLLGKSEADFLTIVKNLGFTNFAKSSTTYYSTTLAKGSVYSYDDGTLKTNTTINYALSAGPLDVSAVAGELNGKTSDQAKSTVSAYNDRNGRITLNVGSEVESSQTAGTLLNCKANDRAIACNVAKAASSTPTTPTTPPPADNTVELKNYVGSSNPCGSNSSCTINEVNFKINSEYSSKAEGTVISQSVAAGKVNKGTTVTLTVSKGPEPVKSGSLINVDMLNSTYKKDTVDGTWNEVSAKLREIGFTNIKRKEELSHGSLTTGCVIRYEVNGSSVKSGTYSLDTEIIVVICSGQEN